MRWRIDSGIDALQDILGKLFIVKYETDKSIKDELHNLFFEKQFPIFCVQMENRLKTNTSNKYLVGDNISILDFAMAGFAYGFVLNEDNEFHQELIKIVDNCQVLLNYFKHLGHELSDYLQNRPKIQHS